MNLSHLDLERYKPSGFVIGPHYPEMPSGF